MVVKHHLRQSVHILEEPAHAAARSRPPSQRMGGPESRKSSRVSSRAAQEDFKRFQVGNTPEREVVVKPPSPKTDKEIELMTSAVENNKSLQAVLNYSVTLCREMVEWAWKEVVPEETNVVTQGEAGDYFYIIQNGVLNVIVDNKRLDYQLTSGMSFGELALLFLAPRAATVRTATKTVLWVIDRNQFKAILAKAAEEALKQFTVYLLQIEGMECLNKKALLKAANALVEVEYSRGDTIYQQGEDGTSFFIVTEGEAASYVDGEQVDTFKAFHKSPIILGERTMVSSEPRTETVRVTSETAFAMTMDRGSFDLIVTAKNAKKKNLNKPSSNLSKGLTTEYHRENGVSLKDLTSVGVLGTGAFGLVELMEDVRSGETYALKTLSKGHIVKSGLQEGVMNEKNIQFMCDSPFIIRLYETYNTQRTLCLLMEPALGGEVLFLYNKHKLHGKEGHAKYYVAGIVFAFEHMHAKKIVYRDLKPENLILDAVGRPKLTDMGLAKVSPGKTFTTCGSLLSMAPEVIKSIGHNQAADWWTLGVMLFELMAGESPFMGPSPAEIYTKIFAGINKVHFPRRMQGACESLVKGLCEVLQSKRLPMLGGGVENLKRHDWFKTFNWKAMENRQLEAPFLPEVRSKIDLQNFKTGQPPTIPGDSDYMSEVGGWDEEFATST